MSVELTAPIVETVLLPEEKFLAGIVRQAITEAVKGTQGGGTTSEIAKATGKVGSRNWFDSPEFVRLCAIFGAEANVMRPLIVKTIEWNRENLVKGQQIDWLCGEYAVRDHHVEGECLECRGYYRDLPAHVKYTHT